MAGVGGVAGPYAERVNAPTNSNTMRQPQQFRQLGQGHRHPASLVPLNYRWTSEQSGSCIGSGDIDMSGSGLTQAATRSPARA
jgi:hypothetical protein